MRSLAHRAGSWALTTYIVRHAKAESRSTWEAPDPARPLSPKGMRQAKALARQLSRKGLKRIVSSPYVRCAQTMERLAAKTGLPVEFDERLAAREDPESALELLAEVNDKPSVLCSHGSVIAGLMSELEIRGATVETGGAFRCQSNSTWQVRHEHGRAIYATYRPPPPTRRSIMKVAEKERVAVLDMGSTSFRMVVFETTSDGGLKLVKNRREMLRLGAAIDERGLIPGEDFDRAVAAAHALGNLARDAGVTCVLPVATEAMRSARNGAALAQAISDEVDAHVRIISGEEEACFLFRAFQERVSLGSDTALGFDLGGGSLEMAIGDAREIDWAVTMPIGVTRLRRELVSSDPMRGRDVRRLRQRAFEELEPFRTAIAERAPTRVLASGGTARAFSNLSLSQRGGKTRDREAGLYRMSASELDRLARRLAKADRDERRSITGVSKDRVDLLGTGGVLLTAITEFLGVDGYTTCDWGLREGVALEYIQNR